MDDEAKRPAEGAGPTPAGGFFASLERAQALFARLALAGLLLFVLALLLGREGQSPEGFVGFWMVLFFALYVVSLVLSLLVRPRGGHAKGPPPAGEGGRGP